MTIVGRVCVMCACAHVCECVWIQDDWMVSHIVSDRIVHQFSFFLLLFDLNSRLTPTINSMTQWFLISRFLSWRKRKFTWRHTLFGLILLLREVNAIEIASISSETNQLNSVWVVENSTTNTIQLWEQTILIVMVSKNCMRENNNKISCYFNIDIKNSYKSIATTRLHIGNSD